MMIFGEKQKFCITYKSNQPDFVKFNRKMIHDFRVRVSTENFENAIGWNIVNKRSYLVAKPDGQVIVFDEHNYEERYRIDLKLP